MPIRIGCHITRRNNKPCVELRRVSTDEELIKLIILAVLHKRSLIIVPSFEDDMRGVSNLIEKGILYRQGDDLFFTF